MAPFGYSVPRGAVHYARCVGNTLQKRRRVPRRGVTKGDGARATLLLPCRDVKRLRCPQVR
jgi:hypothetical protein